MTTLEQYRNARGRLERGSVELPREMIRPEWAINKLDEIMVRDWNHVGFDERLTQEAVTNQLADIYCTLRSYFAMRMHSTASTIISECEELFIKKNADYGDAYAQLGPVGVVMAVYHKLRRLAVLQKNAAQVTTEGVSDTMRDCLNYLILTLCAFSA